MSDLFVNIRFGTIHWQIGKTSPWVRIKRNNYWIEYPPGFKDWFKVYEFFWYSSRH